MTARPIVRLLTCGSVDDGKSTLIGRLLVETESIPLDTVAAARTTRRPGSIIPPGEIDFSLLTDGLEAEREQGITIDVAYRSMSLPDGRRLIIADAPGHEQYTRNMVVAASRADIALVLVDASRGVRSQTLRHLTICSMLGVGKFILVVNKLDKMGFAPRVFDQIVDALRPVVDRLGIGDITYIPVSALAGDNVVFESEHTCWYHGRSILDEIQGWRGEIVQSGRPRLGVQLVLRTDGFRGVAGTISAGRFRVGDELVVLPGERRAKLTRLVTMEGDLERAETDEAVALVLEPEVDATRGDYIEKADNYIRPADLFTARLVWFNEEALVEGYSCYLANGSSRVTATVTSIRHRLDVDNGQPEAALKLFFNEIGTVEIETGTPMPLANYSEDRVGGNFILIDRVTCDTVGAGMVIGSSRRATNVRSQSYEIDKAARVRQKGHRSRVLWLTGLPGAGKSSIANALEKELFAVGIHSYTLDGDNLRLGLNRNLGFTRDDRAENVRRVAEVARLMADAGLVVIVALVSPFRLDRERARELFEPDEFIEVWIQTPVEVCAMRDPKGLYRKAQSGSLPNFTGIGQEYEPPLTPEIVLDGTAEVDFNVDQLMRLIR